MTEFSLLKLVQAEKHHDNGSSKRDTITEQ